MPPHRLHAPTLVGDSIGLTAMRSLLVTAVGDESDLGAALSSGADAIVIDLEGAIAGDDRAAARACAARFLNEAKSRRDSPTMIVKVSRLGGQETDRDLDAVMPGAPDAIMLPGSLGAASVQQLSVKLALREAMSGIDDGSTRILALATQTARALFGMASYRGASARLTALVWSADELSADLKAETHRDVSGAYVATYRLARDLMLFAAAAARVAAIDAAFPNVADSEGLRTEAEEARRDGFAGKIAMDPIQARIINEVFGSRSVPLTTRPPTGRAT